MTLRAVPNAGTGDVIPSYRGADETPRASADYDRYGISAVPLKPRSKECSAANWKDIDFKAEDFEPGDNIGIRSINGLVVTDADAPEAVACAPKFLPPTGPVYGRPSKPASKRLYRSPFEKTIAFKDLDAGDTLIEIRANHQDMAPPSIHPEGEPVRWEPGATFDVSTVEAADLLRAGRLIATTALVSRYYNPAGNRHEWCLALAGFLRSLGITETECVTAVTAAARWANDGKLADRLTEVKSTYHRSDDEPTAGVKALIDAMDRGKTFVKSLQKIWGGSASGPFITNEKGIILKDNQENIRRALSRLGVTLAFNVFKNEPRITWGQTKPEKFKDHVSTRLRLEIDTKFHFLPSKEQFNDIVIDACRRHSFHPVKDYFGALPTWDGVPRTETWLIEAGGAGDSKYTRAVSRLVLCAAVKRILEPGCKFDEMLILESGTQGLEKSTALRTLCPNEEWFSDDLPLNVDSKQIIERTSGKWIIEASDMTGATSAKVEHIKSMLSRQVDGPVRLAYERLPDEVGRSFIIVGTTNDYTYLTDMTGNRRFWPVRIKQLDIAWIRAHRDQLWAEAYARVRAGESIRLDPSLYEAAALQQDRRRTNHGWESVLALTFGTSGYARLSPMAVCDALGIPIERRTTKVMEQINKILQSLGFRRGTVSVEGVKVWGFVRGTKAQPVLEDVADEARDEGEE